MSLTSTTMIIYGLNSHLLVQHESGPQNENDTLISWIEIVFWFSLPDRDPNGTKLFSLKNKSGLYGSATPSKNSISDPHYFGFGYVLQSSTLYSIWYLTQSKLFNIIIKSRPLHSNPKLNIFILLPFYFSFLCSTSLSCPPHSCSPFMKFLFTGEHASKSMSEASHTLVVHFMETQKMNKIRSSLTLAGSIWGGSRNWFCRQTPFRKKIFFWRIRRLLQALIQWYRSSQSLQVFLVRISKR